MKIAVVLMGGHGAGKSTLRKLLSKGGPEELRRSIGGVGEHDGYRLTLYGNCAALGTHMIGADCDISPETNRLALAEAFQLRDVVLIDTMGYSRAWAQMVASSCADLVSGVFFDLSLPTLLGRIQQRRAGNGQSKEPDLTLVNNVQGSMGRAKRMLTGLVRYCRPPQVLRLVHLGPATTPGAAVEQVQAAASAYLSAYVN